MYIKIKNLPILSREEEYRDGANSPTVVTRYACPCKQGEIVEKNTVGFHDRFISLKCEKCLQTYDSFISISGDDFKLYPAK